MIREKSTYSSRRTALIAVTSHDEAQKIAKLLQGKGFEMLFAGNAIQAACRIREEKPTLVVLDEELPDGGGLKALESIRSSVTMTTQPIILRNAMSSPELEIVVRERRAIPVRKPLIADELLYALRRVMKEEFRDSLEISDPVTGFYTLQSVLLLGEQQVKLSARSNRPLTLLRIKVADMGRIIYEHGLKEADRALAETAKTILSTFRKSDIKARVGPDEFLVITLESEESSNGLIADRFRKSMEGLNQMRIIPFEVCAVMTMCTFHPVRLRPFVDLLRCADNAAKAERCGNAGDSSTGGTQEVPAGDVLAFSKQVTTAAVEIADPAGFPAATLKAFNVLRDVNADIRELEEIISTDPPLAARVLKIASSPFFSGGRVTDSIHHAVSIVGLECMRTVIISAFLYDICRSAVPEEKKLWEHSMGVAVVSALLSKKIGTTRENIAFIAGLFHDIGKLALRNAYPDVYSALIDSVEGSDATFCEAENDRFGCTHTVAGGVVARRWDLPRLYRTVVEHHHDRKTVEGLTEEERQLLDIVKAADEVAFFTGIGLKRRMVAEPLLCLDMGITSDTLHEFLWEVDEKFAEYKEIVDV